MAEETAKTVEVNEYGEVINPISNIITTKQPKVKKLEVVEEVKTEEVKTGASAISTNSGGEETKTVVSTDKK